MSTYSEISSSIFNYFYEKSLGFEYFILAFDDTDLNVVSKNLQIAPEDLLKNIIETYTVYYSKINKDNHNWPFGIAALQILCASQMGLNINYSHREFNPILAEMIGINISDLQILYRATQDETWQSLKNTILNLGYQTNIPDRTHGSGRYVQYPKSQSYFNHNDLNSFQYLFASNPQIFPCLEIGQISFFDILCKGKLTNKAKAPLAPRAIKLITDKTINQEILKSQIYNFYCSLEEFESHIKDELNFSNQSYKLFYDDTNGFYLSNENSKIVCVENNLKRLLNSYNVIRGKTKYIILKRDPGYGEFYRVIKADLGDLVKILVFDFNDLINQCLLGNSPSISFQNHEIKIYDLVIPNEMPDYSCLFKKIVNVKEETALAWLQGIKLDRNTYLSGYGPSYRANFKTRVYVDKRYYEINENEILDLSDLEIGFHIIQPVNGRKISFTIFEALFTEPPFISCTGWDLNTFTFSNSEFSVSGLKINKISKNNNFSTRNFIDISTGKKLDSNPSNQLFKLLTKNRNHGSRIY